MISSSGFQDSDKKLKVIILHNIINPHVNPLFEAISNLPDISLKVYFLSESAKDRKWSVETKLPFQYEILSNTVLNLHDRERGLFPFVINPSIGLKLFKERYDVLVCSGWESPSAYMALLVCKLRKKRFVLWSGTTVNEKSSRWKFTTPFKKLLAAKSDACISYGTLSREFLVSLGAEKRKTFISYNTVDVEYFRDRANSARNERRKILDKLGVSGDSSIILYVGQLIQRKGIDHLLKAYGRLRREDTSASLFIVGYGPEERALKEMCIRDNIPDVHFKSFIDLPDLPEIYAVSAVFVLPSKIEVWGLVLNEAMACGLPIITTNTVGASRDLVEEGVNGFVVCAGDEEALYLGMKTLVSDRPLRERMGRESLRIISGFTYKNVVRGFQDAFEFVNRSKSSMSSAGP
ncbi:MAG: glycosyltransferase family 4 protein [Candidatus Eisenbacteria bacterium]|nr:glycosyltransferase family 4 protein [Candidatus Eisenbacteria bacterium]